MMEEKICKNIAAIAHQMKIIGAYEWFRNEFNEELKHHSPKSDLIASKVCPFLKIEQEPRDTLGFRIIDRLLEIAVIEE